MRRINEINNRSEENCWLIMADSFFMDKNIPIADIFAESFSFCYDKGTKKKQIEIQRKQRIQRRFILCVMCI